MERLTYRENDWVGVHDQTDGVVSTNSQAVHRLAEYEDFMEENNIKDLDQLELMAIFYDTFSKKRENQIIDEHLEIKRFFKKQGFESLEEAKLRIEYYKDTIDSQKFNYNNLHKYKNQLQQENQALKDRWEKLKECIAEEDRKLHEIEDECETDRYMTYGEINGYCYIKNKMQELEQGEADAKD